MHIQINLYAYLIFWYEVENFSFFITKDTKKLKVNNLKGELFFIHLSFSEIALI